MNQLDLRLSFLCKKQPFKEALWWFLLAVVRANKTNWFSRFKFNDIWLKLPCDRTNVIVLCMHFPEYLAIWTQHNKPMHPSVHLHAHKYFIIFPNLEIFLIWLCKQHILVGFPGLGSFSTTFSIFQVCCADISQVLGAFFAIAWAKLKFYSSVATHGAIC